jgi:hypothetical protein
MDGQQTEGTVMDEDNRRRANVFPNDMMGGLAFLADRLQSVDWTNPDKTAQGLFDNVAKLDYQAVYSGLMARCIMFWLSPEEMRKKNRGRPQGLGWEARDSESQDSGPQEGTLETSQEAARPFDVLWLAYERWAARGFAHYTEVGAALSKFYSQLRWGMALQRSADGIPPDVEKKIAEEAYHYLIEVKSLVERDYALFQKEMEPMLNMLIEINPEIAIAEPNQNAEG